MVRVSACALVLALAGAAQAQSFTEGFDPGANPPAVTTGLPAGWVSVNNSPGGPGTNPNWNWRNDGAVFPQLAGTGYAYANFNSSTGSNNISNYLMSPVVNFSAGDTISFWTRTVDVPSFPDRLALVVSTNGASTNPADFSTTLLTVNATLTTAGYPVVWTNFVGTVPVAGSGRFAFWYNPTNGGPLGANSDYIGVDEVAYTAVPAPASLALLGLGGLVAGRRRRA